MSSPALKVQRGVPAVAQDTILKQYIERGRVIINQGLNIRRTLDNPSPGEFENMLPRFERGKGLQVFNNAVRRLSNLNASVVEWVGKSATFVQSFKEDAFTPVVLGNWGAIFDEMTTLRLYTNAAFRAARIRALPDKLLEDIVRQGERLVNGAAGIIKGAAKPSTLAIVALALGAAAALVFLLSFVIR